MSDILIGTSGYDHPELKGVFYPETLRRKDFLLYYSTKFNALELNSTFYGMPTAERMLSFCDRSEGRVSFSVKANQLLTHRISGDWKDSAAAFREAMEPVANRNLLSSILFQFPESFRYTVENRLYLGKLIEYFNGFPVAVEFRHRDWIRESVFDGLSRRDASIVFCDMPRLRNLPDGFSLGTPFIGRLAYIRLHGRNSNGWYAAGDFASSTDTPRYDYEYSLDELGSFVPIIDRAVLEGRTVEMFFNNHPKGVGTRNALEMKALLENRGGDSASGDFCLIN